MPQYRVAEAVKAQRLNAAAGVHANAADKANEKANDYVLAVVLFAACLFFAGISTKLHSLRQREVLLAHRLDDLPRHLDLGRRARR